MKRNAEKQLGKWLKRSNRKPLVVRGARQVGKSTLIRNFSEAQKLNLFEVNLERNLPLTPLFKDIKLKELLAEIEVICGKRGITSENAILFLDEIQAIPEAIPTLRYLYEDYPSLKVIAAGSLLETVLSNHNFSMPVGRIEYLFLNPMDFSEFLLASDEDLLYDCRTNYTFDAPFSPAAHERLLELSRNYILVGGMPEAVLMYKDKAEWEEITAVQTAIIETYIDDFAKYARGRTLQILQKVFTNVALSPGRKTKYVNLDPYSQARDVKNAVDLLCKARVIFPVHHSSASGLPLNSAKNDKIFKLYFLDVGLVSRIAKISALSLSEMKSVGFINKGTLAEQFALQNLLASLPTNESPELFYWLREGRNNNAEVDFLIQHRNEILPIEVKAGSTGTLKSLHRFVYEKNVDKAIRFDLAPPSKQRVKTKIVNSIDNAEISYTLFSLPLYMADTTNELLNRAPSRPS